VHDTANLEEHTAEVSSIEKVQVEASSHYNNFVALSLSAQQTITHA
jgi:hypothetical protein